MTGDYDPYAIGGKPSDEGPRERVGASVGAGTSAANELRAIIERMERLAEEKSAIGDDEKAEMANAKARGFDTKAIRTIIRMRKQDPTQRTNEQTVLETYMAALGMLEDEQ